ncbi:hypothetical protein AB4Z45_08505 [Paenibacillus sp. MCAF9]|uniref:hypothetical protein n=1 Tax=Paenibacillus sp. MCAF9 TaxID=3233046 RepID=UPI003F9E01F0
MPRKGKVLKKIEFHLAMNDPDAILAMNVYNNHRAKHNGKITSKKTGIDEAIYSFFTKRNSNAHIKFTA